MVEATRYTIYQLIRDWAQATPEAIAIASPCHEAITYRELLNQIDSTIHSLNEIGVSAKDRVAMAMSDSVLMATTFLGVSCTAISVPLNPSCRENEVDYCLSDILPKALIVQASIDTAAVAAAHRRNVPIIEIKSDPAVVLNTSSRQSLAPVSSTRYCPPGPDEVALILHTSGTTSKPKRVPLTHRNLCASAFSIRKTLNLTTSDRCLGVMPLFHIHGLVGGLLSSLVAGASFAVTPQFHGDRFFDWMAELAPTWYTAVPAIHQEILRRAQELNESIAPYRLRFIRSASAPLPHKVRIGLEQLFNVPVIEAYGMTEAAHQICSNPMPPGERKPGSVGTATQTDIAVVDQSGNLLGAGNFGEIVIRGTNVIAGYERDEAHKDSFIEGWLRTGDLGYLDSEGYLFLTGRLKEVINRGGDKISPREIDDALLEHPDVLHAAAFGIPHPTLGEDLAVAVVPRDPTRINEASIREHLGHRLASFKMPTRLFIVDHIPRSSTGKLQRAHLAKLFSERLPGDFVAPRNQLEARVARIFADVLNISQVGALDNFFALGGDSLRAAQVLSRVRSQLSANLPISTLFLKPTVAELAQEVASANSAGLQCREGNDRIESHFGEKHLAQMQLKSG